MICSFASSASAAPPVVSGVTASQRTGTKIVDISYNLATDGGQKAFVELWFSPDNGLNFPVRCVAITGDADANVTAGAKSVEWNAESDWDQQFTQSGRIRVIATYGDQPSGFAGSGGTANAGGGGSSSSGQADASMVTVFWDSYYSLDVYGGGGTTTFMDESNLPVMAYGGPNLAKVYLDPAEVTNAKWNEVAQWALSNGYSALPLASSSEPADLPRTNITYWEAVRWCNARSEMDGLTPIYYVDGNESLGDMNGNGIVDNGNEQGFSEDWYSPDAHFDPNNNGVHDPGEPIGNDDGDGIWEPKEWEDLNDNNQMDVGLSQVIRSTVVPSVPSATNLYHVGLFSFMKAYANGYRLPDEFVMKKAATGGLSQKKWPWGDDQPDMYGNFSTEYRVSMGMGTPLTGPTASTTRQANGLGVKDVIGNVAEWTNLYFSDGGGMGGSQLIANAHVYGGSYLGLMSADDPWSGGGDGTSQFNNSVSGGGGGDSTPESLFHLEMYGLPTAKSTAVGFRCASYVWSN